MVLAKGFHHVAKADVKTRATHRVSSAFATNSITALTVISLFKVNNFSLSYCIYAMSVRGYHYNKFKKRGITSIA